MINLHSLLHKEIKHNTSNILLLRSNNKNILEDTNISTLLDNNKNYLYKNFQKHFSAEPYDPILTIIKKLSNTKEKIILYLKILIFFLIINNFLKAIF